MRGSIRTKVTGKVYELRVSLGRDPVTGRYRQKSVTVRGTRADAQRALRRLLDDVETGQHQQTDGGSRSFGELLDWLDGHPLAMRLTLPRLDTTGPTDLLAGLKGTTPLPAADDPDSPDHLVPHRAGATGILQQQGKRIGGADGGKIARRDRRQRDSQRLRPRRQHGKRRQFGRGRRMHRQLLRIPCRGTY